MVILHWDNVFIMHIKFTICNDVIIEKDKKKYLFMYSVLFLLMKIFFMAIWRFKIVFC